MHHFSTSSGFLTSGWRGLGTAVERKEFLIKESRQIIYHPHFSLNLIQCKAVFFHWPLKHLVVPSSCGRAPKPTDQMSDALRTQSRYRLCLKHRTRNILNCFISQLQHSYVCIIYLRFDSAGQLHAISILFLRRFPPIAPQTDFNCQYIGLLNFCFHNIISYLNIHYYILITACPIFFF